MASKRIDPRKAEREQIAQLDVSALQQLKAHALMRIAEVEASLKAKGVKTNGANDDQRAIAVTRETYAKGLRKIPVKSLLGSAKLTTRQRMFVTAYVTGPSGVRGIANRAAVVAGFSARDPNVGDYLVKHPAVRETLARYFTKWDLKAEDVIGELRRIALADPRATERWGPDGVTLLDSDEITDDAAATVAEVSQTVTDSGGTMKIKHHDKNVALGLLAKYFGIVSDRVEHTGRNGGPVELSTYVYLPANGRELDPAQVRQMPDDVVEAAEVRAISAGLLPTVILPPSGRERENGGPVESGGSA